MSENQAEEKVPAGGKIQAVVLEWLKEASQPQSAEKRLIIEKAGMGTRGPPVAMFVIKTETILGGFQVEGSPLVEAPAGLIVPK